MHIPGACPKDEIPIMICNMMKGLMKGLRESQCHITGLLDSLINVQLRLEGSFQLTWQLYIVTVTTPQMTVRRMDFWRLELTVNEI